MISILGAGAFGAGLAISFARTGGAVTLWARDAAAVARMRDTRAVPRLSGVVLPASITVTDRIADLPQDGPVLLAVPMQKLRALLTTHADALRGRVLVACCKGIELSTGKRPSEIVDECVADATFAMLTGPSFAADIARGLPTALTLACADADCGADLQQRLTARNLRLYRTADVTGAELGGALKNVMAIACGAAMGARLGESARAALMTRGYAEMQRMALHLGAEPTTLAGLAGFGDLTLTCTSEQSRNYRFGRALGRDEGFDDAITVEGAATSRAVLDLAGARGLDMPITEVVAALCQRTISIEDAMGRLLNRPLKEE
ncbi:NAD(P)H-dependent glycerol-3-phosphate dehydrogenase [Pseudooceanicola aestuarii]|uniref:NAD(P)H-dependent glycerol-3-phosphate dehydrogenase n=1 Tax=Pseudooceanicola aestuarii TaxID=2697319 RepID=UPI0013D678AD|nr:NAD(P)H-dependent glycerol-3-phosphate dehydrogenase [Pseudooceanicola aestuarii]